MVSNANSPVIWTWKIKFELQRVFINLEGCHVFFNIFLTNTTLKEVETWWSQITIASHQIPLSIGQRIFRGTKWRGHSTLMWNYKSYAIIVNPSSTQEIASFTTLTISIKWYMTIFSNINTNSLLSYVL